VIVRVATLSQAGSFCRSVEGNREHVASLVDQAGHAGVDLVCLPEAFTARNVPVRGAAEVAEPLPGPTTERFAALARKHRCYVVCPLYSRHDGLLWNSAVLLDREGAIAAVYDKACPAADQAGFEGGVTPGAPARCLRLDFGTIGVQICFDLEFGAGWAGLAAEGARLVVWPAAHDGGLRVRARALEHGFHVVTAVRDGAARAIDPCGGVVAETSPQERFRVARLNLDYAVAYAPGEGGVRARVRERYGDRVEVTWHPGEARLLVASLDGGPPAEAVARELGLEAPAAARARHEAAYREARR
jgi:beta-ureidopropionase